MIEENIMRVPAICLSSVLLVLAAAACGQQSGSPAAQGDSANPTTVSISVVPSIDSISLYLADDKGFLADEGLDVEFVQAGSGPAAAASVVSNATQFGLSANVAILQARSKNVPLAVAAPAAGTGSDPAKSKDQVVVTADSDIDGFADLSDRKVAVVAVKNSPELFVRDMVDSDGGDSSSIEFLELPFAEMQTALEAGRVDAIAINEPFLSGALAAGGVPIGSYIDDVLGSNTGYTYWFTSEQFAERAPETVAAFQRAMAKASTYADEHPDEVREAVTSHLDIDAEIAARINLPSFSHELEEDPFIAVSELMERYDFLEEPVSTDDLIVRAR